MAEDTNVYDIAKDFETTNRFIHTGKISDSLSRSL